MRRGVFCVLMMTLLLCACGAGEGGRRAEEEALLIRGEYLSQSGCSGSAELRADYGQRVYQYTLDFTVDPGGTVLTLTAPESVEGITARISPEGEGVLEYDGVMLETGPLDAQGLTPVSAVPAILEALGGAYLDSCGFEQWGEREVLCLCLRDPELEPGLGREFTLWLDRETHSPLRGELCSNGFCVISCEFTRFAREEAPA